VAVRTGYPIWKLAGLVMDGAPRKTSGVPWLVTNDVNNTIDRDWIKHH